MAHSNGPVCSPSWISYLLIRICKEDECKTEFKTLIGHFEYRVMAFGLNNAPRRVPGNDVLLDMLYMYFVYIDDILVFSETDQRRNTCSAGSETFA